MKTARPVRCELAEVTRQALDDYLEEWSEGGAILVPWPAVWSVADDAPLCSASLPMDHRHWLGSAQLHNPFRAGPKPHLSANGDFTRGATFARTPAHRLCPGRDYVPCGYLSRSDRALMLSALDIGSLLVGHSRPQGARLNMLHSAPKLCRDGTVQRVLQRVLKEAK